MFLEFGATRTISVAYCFDHFLVLKMTRFDLPWGTGDDLLGRQNTINNKAANDVAGHFQAFSGLFHGQPLPIFLGRPKSMDALNPANGADTVRSPGFVLTRSNAHSVQRCSDIVVGITSPFAS
ncbi:hypothetical protein [Sinorhizobium meliloti]|uniref:hypothetical protein n=1 Tax=Rhizobium meliloti TaxID=382 RepID=UPI0012FD130F